MHILMVQILHSSIMKMTSLLKLLILLPLITFGFTEVEKEVFLSSNVAFYTVNKLNQIYVVKEDNSITKHSINGKELITKNLKVQGELHSLDASNVFDILLFYKNLNTIITADNLLNQRNTINFNDNEFTGTRMISAACRSFDNKIWVFDILTQRLLKVDGSGKIQLESSSLPNQTELKNVHHIIESSPNVYLIDSSQIVKMNIYGKLLTSIKTPFSIYNAYMHADSLRINGLDSSYTLSNNHLRTDKLKNNTSDFRYYQNGSLFLRNDSLFLQQK